MKEDLGFKALEEKASALATQRDSDGRYVARYPGILKPKLDPKFDKTVWVQELVQRLKEDTVTKLTAELAHGFEQLCWWNLRRKGPGVEVFGVGGVHGISIHHPDGAWIVQSIGWRKL